jgi:hypothetical protein
MSLEPSRHSGWMSPRDIRGAQCVCPSHGFPYSPLNSVCHLHRDLQSRRPVEVFVSVAFNQYHGSAAVGDGAEECSSGPGAGGGAGAGECAGAAGSESVRMVPSRSAEIILYYSLVEPVEEVDEVSQSTRPSLPLVAS